MRRYKTHTVQNTSDVNYNHKTRELTIKQGFMTGVYKDMDTYSAEVIISLLLNY